MDAYLLIHLDGPEPQILMFSSKKLMNEYWDTVWTDYQNVVFAKVEDALLDNRWMGLDLNKLEKNPPHMNYIR